VSAIGVPDGVLVRATDGPVGVVVEGIDLADDLDCRASTTTPRSQRSGAG